jgi:hypothetical protein
MIYGKTPYADTGTPTVNAVSPTATNRPEELTVTSCIIEGEVDPFINAGVIHVVPSVDVAYKGALVESYPTATNFPEELTVTLYIYAAVVDPFMSAGVVHVDPLDDVAYTG